MAENSPDLWIREIHKDIVGLSFRAKKTLFSERSKFQKIDVIETEGHGAVLLNDGVIMLSERDEFVYHEMIAHVPMFAHPRPERVLVVGGGDGGTVREVLKHREVRRAVMVEIDEMVIRASRECLPDASAALDDDRLELVIGDGVKFVAETDEQFDIVLVDSTDPVGPAKPLFNSEFYQGVSKILAPDGILVTQAESPFYDADLQEPMFVNQRPFFKKLHMYLFNTLTYPGGLWSFGFASKMPCPLNGFDPARIEKSGISTRYYNADIHRAAFALPNFVKEQLSEVLDPL